MMTLPTANNRLRESDSSDGWLLWVDGAGGFLVVDRDEVSIGGPASENEAAIGVQADLHRREALLIRADGEYVVQPIDGTVSISGQVVKQAVPLRANEPFTLGDGIQFWFHQPSPLSASAKLTVAARTRLRPHVDAVLLFDDTLVIGPSDDCHIRVPHAEGALVLMRRGEQWQVKPIAGAAAWRQLTPGLRMEGLGISLTLEPR